MAWRESALGGVLGCGTPSARRSRRSGYDDPSTALSAAYYAMLYPARAALSEREIYAKTRRGAWHEFRREFVDTGKMDPTLATAVQKVQPEREQADYDAWEPPSAEARRVIEMAGAFLAAVEELLA